MQHVEKCPFRKGEYTALAGTAETLTRFTIKRRSWGWGAWPASWTPTGYHFEARTLRELDAKLAEFSKRLTSTFTPSNNVIEQWSKHNDTGI